MIKKIASRDLVPGMYIHDLSCGWMDHPFLTPRFKIKGKTEIDKILKARIREVYIDTDKGLDVSNRVETQTETEVAQEIDTKLQELMELPAPQDHTPAPLMEETKRAVVIKKEARRLAQNVMEDVRMGKQVETGKVEAVVENLVDSIFRNEDALLSLGLIKQNDEYTFQHSVNVCVFLISFAKALGLPYEEIQHVGVGALLHDIGKMRVPQEILNKPGKLTDDEFSKMKEHAIHSDIILRATQGIHRIAAEVAGRHHERFDGSGYPLGMKGGEIGLHGQMAAIVDVYDAITSDRVYHKGMTAPEALRKILEWSKFHFNQDLAQKFIRSVGIYPIGSLVRLENEHLAVVVQSGTASLLHPVLRVVFDAKRGRGVNPPQEIRLSELVGQEGGYRIRGHEPADKWGINPMQFLPQMAALMGGNKS